MAEVFISYARANVAIAQRLADALKAKGFQVWWDQQLPSHEAYGEVIEQKLRSADAIVVLWSKEAAQSQWVRAEADLARTRGKLVQALADGTQPPLPFNQFQCADLKGWRGSDNHAGWTRLVESVAAVAGAATPGPQPQVDARTPRRRRLILGGFALALLAVFAFVGFRMLWPAAQGPTTVAVLPFKTLSAGDESLAYGLWEDTRQALSRNPQLRVIGRQTAEALGREGLDPREYRARLDIGYLLDGTVRRAGDRVRVSVNLVRTDDAAQIWSETLEGKLDDIFKLQQQIAGEIEGRIRGRLAKDGGVMPENIATSGAVYLLFNEARATVRNRDYANFESAHAKLTRAVEMDPNFAPGWAALAVAERFLPRRAVVSTKTGREAEGYARRAITLAPNLAAGHTALGIALPANDRAAEAALRRAIQLDPNDIETLNWLAIVEINHGRLHEALKLYARAVKIEPLWWPSVLARLDVLLEQNDAAAVAEEMTRLERSGSTELLALAKLTILEWRGDFSEAVKVGLIAFKRGPESKRILLRGYLSWTLLRLGYVDEAIRINKLTPPFARYLWANDPRGLDMVEALGLPPRIFWTRPPLTEGAGRVYLLTGRAARLAALYRGVASSPEQLALVLDDPRRFVHLAPLVVLALRQTGDQAEAERLLDAAAAIIEQQESGGALWQPSRDHRAYRARVLAVQGRLPEAAAALAEAVDLGWRPEIPKMLIDLQLDPAFALLKDIPRFQQARRKVLAHVLRERKELGPVTLN